jgi:hypothetical protein
MHTIRLHHLGRLINTEPPNITPFGEPSHGELEQKCAHSRLHQLSPPAIAQCTGRNGRVCRPIAQERRCLAQNLPRELPLAEPWHKEPGTHGRTLAQRTGPEVCTQRKRLHQLRPPCHAVCIRDGSDPFVNPWQNGEADRRRISRDNPSGRNCAQTTGPEVCTQRAYNSSHPPALTVRTRNRTDLFAHPWPKGRLSWTESQCLSASRWHHPREAQRQAGEYHFSDASQLSLWQSIADQGKANKHECSTGSDFQFHPLLFLRVAAWKCECYALLF